MAKQLNIDLNVRANTQQAKAEFQSLQQALSDVATTSAKMSNTKINTAQFKEASMAAQELQRHLNNAVDVNTGKLNLNKLNLSLKQSKTNLGNLTSQLLTVGTTGEQAFVKVAQSIAMADRPVVTLGTRLNDLLTTLKNTARWQISSSILHGFLGSISKAYGYAKDLNKSLNDIRIVSGQNTDQMAKFAEAANKAAKELSTTTTAYTKASLIYYQQGLSDEEVKKRTDTTIKLANVSRQSSEEVSSQMTAIWNNFAKDGEGLERYADVITKLGASTASSSSEIAEGLQKFASVADTVGLSYDKAAASVATVVAETRQSADTVGTAFKTMFARIQGLKLGETLEDGVDLNKYSSALKTIGVDILDANKQVKDMDTILDEVGQKWNKIGESEKIAVSETVAGVRQYTQFMALMNNYDKVQKNQSLAENAGGTLQEQADTYAESWEAASQRVEASLEAVYKALLDDKFFINLANGFSTLLEGVNQFIKGIGGVYPLLIGIGSIFISKVANQIQPALTNLKTSIITTFQTPAQQAKTYSSMMQSMIATAEESVGHLNDRFSLSSKVGLEYANNLSIAKNKLIIVDKQLTAEEKQVYDASLNMISIYQQEVQALANKIEKEKEAITTMMDSMNTEKATTKVKDSRTFGLDALKGELQEIKALRDSFKFDSEGNPLDINGKIDLQGFIEASEKYEKLTGDVSDYEEKTNMLADTNENLIISLRQGYESLVQVENGLSGVKEIEIDLGQHLNETGQSFVDLGEKASFTGEDLLQVNECLEDLRTLDLHNFEEVSDQMQKVQNAMQAYREAIKNGKKDTAEMDDIINKLQTSLNNMGTIIKGDEQGVGRLVIKFKSGSSEAEKFRQTMQKIDGKNIKQIDTAYKQVSKDQQQLTLYQERLNQAFSNFNPKHMMSGVEIFTKMSSAGMQAAMAIQSVKSMWEAWSNDDLSIGEKITTSLMSIGMITPSVIGAFTSIKTVIQGLTAARYAHAIAQKTEEIASKTSGLAAVEEATAKRLAKAATDEEKVAIMEEIAAEVTGKAVREGVITADKKAFAQKVLLNAQKLKGTVLTDKEVAGCLAAVAATDADTVAKGGEATATEVATVAQEGLNAAQAASPIGLMVLAIAGLIAALGIVIALTIAFANAQSEEQKAVEKANKELTEAKENAEKTKEVYEDIKNKISNYKSAVDALKQYTKGTKEWRDAMQEVNNKINELLQKYPQLLTYANLYKSDGTLNTEVLNEFEKKAEKSASGENSDVLKKTANLYQAEYNRDLKTLQENLKNNYNQQYNKEESSISDQRSAQIINELVNNKDKINFTNKESVLKALHESNIFGPTEAEFEHIADTVVKLNTSFTSLTSESEKATTAFSNMSQMMTTEFFGDDIDTSKPSEMLAGEMVLQDYYANKEKELKTGVQSDATTVTARKATELSAQGAFIGSIVNMFTGLNMYDKDSANKIAEEYLAQHPEKNYDFSHTHINGFNNNVEGLVFKDKNNNNEEVTINIDDAVSDAAKFEAENYDKQNILNNKNAQGEVLSKYNNAVLNYMSTGNLEGATIKDVLNLKKNEAFGDKEGQISDDKIKEILAKQKGVKEEEITDEDITAYKNNFDQLKQTAFKTIDEIPQYMKDKMGKEFVESLDMEALPKVYDMYTKAFANEGQAGVDALDAIKEKAGDEAGAVMKALSDIDLASADTNSINTSLASLGIQCKLSEKDVYNLKAALLDTTTVTAEAAQENYKNISKVLSKIKKEGDSIEDEDYKKLIRLNPAIESFFTTLADGTHVLTGEVTDFKKAMQTAGINQLQTAKKNQEDTAVAYQTLQGENYVKTSSMTGFKKDKKGNVSIAGDNEKNWENYKDQINAQLKILKDNGKDDIVNKYQAMIKEGKEYNKVIAGVAQSYEDLKLTETDYADKAKAAAEEANKLAEAIKEQTYQNEVANANLDLETTDNYVDVLTELYGAENLSKEAARELAIANQRLDRGLTTLNENFLTWQNTLKKTNQASAEYAATIGEVRKSFADLLNIADGKELSLKWVEKWIKDTSKMKQILDGDKKAIQEFRESAFTEMTTNVFSDMKTSLQQLLKETDKAKDKDYYNDMKGLLDVLKSGKFDADNLRSAIQNLNGSEIGAGAKLSDDYVKSLNKMLKEGLITEQQMNDIFSTIGYKPKVTTKQVNQWVEVPIYKTYETDSEDASNDSSLEGTAAEGKKTKSKITWTEQIGTKKMKQSVPVTQIVSNKDADGGNLEIVNAGSQNITPSYGSTTTGKNDTGNNKTSAASHEHNVNRYSNEENAIKGLSDQYARLNKIKDQAFGMSRVQAIENEIKKLKELKKASASYIETIAGKGNASKVAKTIYNGGSIGQLIASGQLGGTIGSDFKSLSGGLSASGKGLEYTAKDSFGNERLVSDSYSLSGFNSTFGTNVKFSLDSYGNLQNKDSILNLIQNLKNKENSAYSSKANPTGADTTAHNKRLAYLEEIKERIDQYNSTAALLGEKTQEYLDYIATLQQKNAEKITVKMETGVELGKKTSQRIERALKILGDTIYKSTEAMQQWYNKTFKEDVKAKKAQARAYDKAFDETETKYKKYVKKNGEFDSKAIDPNSTAKLLSSIEEGYNTLIDDFLSKLEEGKGHYAKTIEIWKNKIADVTSQIELNTQTLDHYQKVLQLAGKSGDYKSMGIILKGQISNAQDSYDVNQRLYKDAEARYKKAEEGYKKRQEQVKNGELSKEALEDYYEHYVVVARQERDNALKAFQSSTTDLLEAINAWYQNEVNRMFHEAEQQLAGEWGTFDLLNKSMERQKSIADEYLTKTNQLYETNTLLRKIQTDVDKTDSRLAKDKLNSFANEIKAMKNKNDLTKVELEIAKARYEVLKAQIALEEAQNAKSTVRLQRDDEGNYGYVYTADQDKVSEAEQNLADKQNNLYNLVLGYTQDYAEKIKKLEEEHMAALEEIANNSLLTEVEKNEAMETINAEYYAKREVLLRNHNEAIKWLDQTAATDRSEAWTESYEKTISDQNAYKQKTSTLCSDLKSLMNDVNQKRTTIVQQAGLDNETLATTVGDVTQKTKDLKTEITKKGGLADGMKTAAKKARKLTEKFYNQYDALKNLITKYQNAADEVNKLYQKVLLLTKAQKDYNQSLREQPNANYGSGNSGGYGDNNNGSTNKPKAVNNTNNKNNKKNDKSITHYQVSDNKTGAYFIVTGDEVSFYQNQVKNGKLVYSISKLKTGGYTGSWTSGKTGLYTGSWDGPDLEDNGKLAFLHQKELVLNADDTENMLQTVKFVRQLNELIDLQALAKSQNLYATANNLATNGLQTIEQEVTIHAEFPNVQNHNEIEEAFHNLINRASQFANRDSERIQY